MTSRVVRCGLGPEDVSAARVRAESAADVAGVEPLLVAAFPTRGEAGLVRGLRGATTPQIALVAERDARLVGYLLLTPVDVLAPGGATRAMGLGPMAVHPSCQRQGIGGALVTAGLTACRVEGELVVFVLGHPSYYPRFGFRPAWARGLYYATPGPNAAFMVVELAAGALGDRRGEVRYHPAFDTV